MIVNRKSTVVLFPTLWIMALHVIWHILKLNHVGSLPQIMLLDTSTFNKVFSVFGIKVRSLSWGEFSKLAVLSTYTIWNARQELAWCSEEQPLLAIWSFFLPCHLLALPVWLLHLFLSISHVFDPLCYLIFLFMLYFSCMFYVPCASLGIGCGLGLIYPPCFASRFLYMLLQVNKGWQNKIP